LKFFCQSYVAHLQALANLAQEFLAANGIGVQNVNDLLPLDAQHLLSALTQMARQKTF
jgi:hypothetical protein